MIEQSKLLECMEEIKAIAMSQQGRLTKEEIGKYLDGMEFDDGQMEAVYQYLCANRITIEGYEYVPERTESDGKTGHSGKDSGHVKGTGQSRAVKRRGTGSGGKTVTKAQRNLQIYRQEVSALGGHTPEQEMKIMRRFLSGEYGLRNEILQGQLQRVISLGEKYQKRGVLKGSLSMDEIIAEGNMGLMNAMAMLEQGRESFLMPDGQPDMEKIHSAIEMEISHAMESAIDEMTEKKDWEDTIVARTNLLHEAAKYLAEEMGRAATREELAEYTRIPIGEIHDIMGISEEVRKAF